jgi:hypothetical protein
MEPINNFHQLDQNNPYSEIGSASYSPTTAQPTPPPLNFAPNQPPMQSNFFNYPPPGQPTYPIRTSISNTIINPPMYDGLTDPSLWLKEYELIANANNWNDSLKIKRLIGSLFGAPRLYYISAIDYNPNLTWYEFRLGLLQRFTNTNESNSSIASIYGRRQQVNESFNDYWFSKLQLIETKRPNLPNIDKKHLLLEGLLPQLHQKVMDQLIVKPTENLEELRDMAKQISDLIMPQPSAQPVKPRRANQLDGNVYMGFGHHTDYTDGWNANQQNYISMDHRKERNNQNIICYICNKFGHIAPKCPNKRPSKNDPRQNN